MLTGYMYNVELSTGRMDPRVGSVGSGHDVSGFWRVGLGRVSTSSFQFFTDYFLILIFYNIIQLMPGFDGVSWI